MTDTLRNPNIASRDELAIRGIIETWHHATATGDVDTIARLMSEDAIFLTPQRRPMRGREAFVTNLKRVLETHCVTSRSDVLELLVSGSFAYCWTDLMVTIIPLDGTNPQVRRGPTLSIFHKEAPDSWLLVRDANMLAGDSAESPLTANSPDEN